MQRHETPMHGKTNKAQGKIQASIECFNPEILPTKQLVSCSELCKCILNVPQSERVRHVALLPQALSLIVLPHVSHAGMRTGGCSGALLSFPPATRTLPATWSERSACWATPGLRTSGLRGHNTVGHLAQLYGNKATADDLEGESDQCVPTALCVLSAVL